MTSLEGLVAGVLLGVGLGLRLWPLVVLGAVALANYLWLH